PRRSMRLALVAALAIGCLAATVGHAQPPRRPNVVLIMSDDMGWGDLGSYGATDVRTPNLDRLAAEGIRLTDFYANGTTCSPDRAALISGLYQQSDGIKAHMTIADRASARVQPASVTTL